MLITTTIMTGAGDRDTAPFFLQAFSGTAETVRKHVWESPEVPQATRGNSIPIAITIITATRILVTLLA